MERRNISSGTVWEPKVGYSRAVRVGPWVVVSGTAAADRDGHVVSPGDAYGQSVFILRKIQTSLEQAGSRMEDVVRTRIFVTNIADFEAVGRAHGEIFGGIRPVTTLVQVSRLLDPAMLVEIEADAIIPDTG
jgi:enamine deaminase RidA (YjgF/YER057c/UK114 family)